MAAPSRPSSINVRVNRALPLLARMASAVSARMPPSPLLSARMTNSTYLMDTTSVIAQKSIDRMPKTV
jgi:hypothetical protein